MSFKEELKEAYDKDKELYDQIAHFVLGGFFVSIVLITKWAIIPLVLAFVIYREYRQHNKLIFLNLDLCFWYLGIALVSIIGIIISVVL